MFYKQNRVPGLPKPLRFEKTMRFEKVRWAILRSEKKLGDAVALNPPPRSESPETPLLLMYGFSNTTAGIRGLVPQVRPL